MERNEKLVREMPESVRVLLDCGIKPLVCGEPSRERLEGCAWQVELKKQEIDTLVEERNHRASKQQTMV